MKENYKAKVRGEERESLKEKAQDANEGKMKEIEKGENKEEKWRINERRKKRR